MFKKTEKARMKIDQHTFHFTFGFDHKWLVDSKAQQTIAVEYIPGLIPQDTTFAFGNQEHGKIIVSLQAIEKAVIFKVGDLQGHFFGLRISQCE